VLISAAAAVLLPAFLVVAWNPWHLVSLMAFSRPLVVPAVGAAGFGLLALAGWLAIRRRSTVVALTVLATAITLVVCMCGGAFDLARLVLPLGPTGEQAVVAVSPDGLHEVVALQYSGVPDFTSILRLRSRAGFWSRESPHDLACVSEHLPGSEVEVRFVDSHTIEIRTDDDDPWTTTFDPRTLQPAATLVRSRCASPVDHNAS
jgi:hypothetical protein